MIKLNNSHYNRLCKIVDSIEKLIKDIDTSNKDHSAFLSKCEIGNESYDDSVLSNLDAAECSLNMIIERQ